MLQSAHMCSIYYPPGTPSEVNCSEFDETTKLLYNDGSVLQPFLEVTDKIRNSSRFDDTTTKDVYLSLFIVSGSPFLGRWFPQS